MTSEAPARFVSAGLSADVAAREVVIGIHTSGARMRVPRNPSDATPTTLKGWPLSNNVRPTVVGSRLKRRDQKRWLNTTIGLPPDASLDSARSAPAGGRRCGPAGAESGPFDTGGASPAPNN